MFAAFEQGCELRVAAQREGDDKVALFYELRNKAERAFFVFHGVAPQESPYYVERVSSGLTISQKVIAPPRGLELERPEIPLASRVNPGERLRQKIELGLPLRESTPYPHLRPRRPRGGGYVVLEAWLEIGFFSPESPEVAREAGEGWVIPGLDPARQSIVRAGPIGRFAFDPGGR